MAIRAAEPKEPKRHVLGEYKTYLMCKSACSGLGGPDRQRGHTEDTAVHMHL